MDGWDVHRIEGWTTGRIANITVLGRNHTGLGPVSNNSFNSGFDLKPVLLVPDPIPIEIPRSSSGTGFT